MCIVFNNVSKVNYPKSTQPEYDSFDDSEEEPEQEVTFKEYIVIYRKTLIEVLQKDCISDLKGDSLRQRIEKLFPDENFYCYQKRNNKEEMVLEWAQAEQFLKDCLNSPSMFIRMGELEPQHLTSQQRDILVNDMEQTMNNCVNETNHSM